MIEGQHLFDVTCIVGSVYTSTEGVIDPYAAALQLIGEHGGPGTYTFPLSPINLVTVTVTFERPAEPVEAFPTPTPRKVRPS